MTIKRAITKAKIKIITALGGSPFPDGPTDGMVVYQGEVKRIAAGYGINPIEAAAYGPNDCFEIARQHILRQLAAAIDEAGWIQYTRKFYPESGRHVYTGEVSISKLPDLDPDDAERLDPRRPFPDGLDQFHWEV